MRVRVREPGSNGRSACVPQVSQPHSFGNVQVENQDALGCGDETADIIGMIIKLIPTKSKQKGVERYAHYLANYMAGADQQWLRPDAIGMDYGLSLSTYMSSSTEGNGERKERVLHRGAFVGGEGLRA